MEMGLTKAMIIVYASTRHTQECLRGRVKEADTGCICGFSEAWNTIKKHLEPPEVDSKPNKRDMIDVMLVSLRARREQSRFAYNQISSDCEKGLLALEGELLLHQIKALEAEREKE